MVQRMGRTGRKRNGKVVILVTEGKEQQTLQECMIQKTNMSNLLSSNKMTCHLYPNNPRMIPDGLTPTCEKLLMTIPKRPEKKERKSRSTIKDRLNDSISTCCSDEISKVPDFDILPENYEFWSKSKGMFNLFYDTIPEYF